MQGPSAYAWLSRWLVVVSAGLSLILGFFAFTSWVDGTVSLDGEPLPAASCAGFSGGLQIELEGREPHRLTVARRADGTVRVALDGLDVDSCTEADLRAEGQGRGPRTTPRLQSRVTRPRGGGSRGTRHARAVTITG